MTASVLEVFLDGVHAGRLSQSRSGDLDFTYDVAYRESADPTPLSLSMPLSVAQHRKRVVLPWLQGLLPDNDDALSAIARRFGESMRNPFALLRHVGVDAAGAVQIMPAGEPAPDAAPQTPPRLVSDDEVAAMLGRVVAEYADGIPAFDEVGRFSLAGAQPKIALHRTLDGAWAVPQGSTPTTHILKPVVGAFRRIDVVEQLTLLAAAELGNDVAAAELTTIGDWDVLVSTRYDRAMTDGRWHRLHQEDLCQALSVSPAKKYQHRDGGPGAARIADLVRSLPLAADREAVGASLFRALVFNVVAGCTDAHAKNYSVMLSGRSVRLAPLYDLLTYAGYWDGRARIQSAMSIDGEYAFDRISAAGLARLGPRFGVAADVAEAIVADVCSRMRLAFDAARERVAPLSPEARLIADEVMAGIQHLPLVAK